jgi:branched-chain amino acid transport system substrate-binding protein
VARRKTLLWHVIACLLVAITHRPAAAQQPVRIGFISTLSGPQGLGGQEILNGFKLALTHTNQQLGGHPVELQVGDDQLKPEIGRQLAEQMIDRDHVDIVTGILNSAVLLALARPVMDDGGKLLISSNAGPSQLAGSQCNANFFSIAAQNDASPEAMGVYLTQQQVKSVFLLSPNYQAGKDKMAGFKRSFKGSIANEVYIPFDQMDYAGQIAEIRRDHPDAVFEFLPGATGISFLKQWHDSGLDKSVRLYTDRGGLDETMIAAVGPDIIGAATASSWSSTLPNQVNADFVRSYQQEYHRVPSLYAAQGYDTVLLLDAAVAATGGKTDPATLRHALLTVQAPSVRGRPMVWNRNHFPMDDYYLMTVARAPDGSIQLATGAKILDRQMDAYVGQCKMAAE